MRSFLDSKKRDSIVQIERNDLKIKLRLIRYKIRGQEYVLTTTLLDSNKYTIRALKDLYHERWGIEEFFKSLKQELVFEIFHSKSPTGVKQEIAASHILLLLSRSLGIQHKFSKIKKPNHTQISCGVASALIGTNFLNFWDKSDTVQKCWVSKVSSSLYYQLVYSPKGRSFPRRSRKVISRWQKSISHEYRSKKRLEAKGLSP